jgi:hypothetical protein
MNLVAPTHLFARPSAALGRAVAKAPAPEAPPWAALLERFYAKAGLPPLRLERCAGDTVPLPYRRLLVHSSDMTPTLRTFYGGPLEVRVLSRDLETATYLREVVLELIGEARPVEYGVIRIRLDHFPPRARRLILEERLPLGAILEQEGLGHLSWPQAFFRVEADGRLSDVLRVPQAGTLYGRRNVLLDGTRRLLAEVIEILAPVEPASCNPSHLL